MFRIRRICKPKTRPDTWKIAGILKKVCAEYEQKGRSPATISITGFGTPGSEIIVCAEWDQESIETNPRKDVPEIITNKYSKELASLVQSNEIEFYEIATAEKLNQWGVM
jgi:hypothetical protein